MSTDDHVVVASTKTPHRRFSAVSAFFDAQDSGSRYWLADPKGDGVELPAELWGLLRDAAKMLAGEGGVTLGSVPATLGLAEAAEFASIPLPTLLQCVADGSVPLSESLTGPEENETVALKDVVKLREYLRRDREVAQLNMAVESPSAPDPEYAEAVGETWSAQEQADPTSVAPSYTESSDLESGYAEAGYAEPSYIEASYPEPTIGPSPISASPASPTSAPYAPVSPAWNSPSQAGHEAVAQPPAPVRVRAVARASVRMTPPVAPSPISAPSVQWTASWSGERPAADAQNTPASAPPPVSVPQTWYAAARS